jgi:hypothetical protein
MRELFGEVALVAVPPTERRAAEAVVGVDYAEHLMEDTINGRQWQPGSTNLGAISITPITSRVYDIEPMVYTWIVASEST